MYSNSALFLFNFIVLNVQYLHLNKFNRTAIQLKQSAEHSVYFLQRKQDLIKKSIAIMNWY